MVRWYNSEVEQASIYQGRGYDTANITLKTKFYTKSLTTIGVVNKHLKSFTAKRYKVYTL